MVCIYPIPVASFMQTPDTPFSTPRVCTPTPIATYTFGPAPFFLWQRGNSLLALLVLPYPKEGQVKQALRSKPNRRECTWYPLWEFKEVLVIRRKATQWQLPLNAHVKPKGLYMCR